MNSRKYGFAIRSEVRKHGEGGEGTCYGDSDGPFFLPDQRMIVGVISFGVNPLCTGFSAIARDGTPR
jgi:secreted trypsin-like serine protease